MSSPPRQDSSDIPVVVGRRSARLSVVIPVTIKGTDAKGQPFKENTWTIGVNKQGGRIATFRQFAVGDELTIENPVLGRTAKAHIVRVGEKRFPEDPYEIGIELNEPQNVWGIKFPPEDWQRSVPPGRPVAPSERRLEPTPTRVAAKPSVPPPSEAVEPPKAPEAAAPTATEAGEPSEKFSQFSLAVEALSRYARQAERAAGVQPPSLEQKPGAPAEQIEFERRAALEEAVERLEEKEKLARSLEEQLSTLTEFMRASRADLESLLAKFHDFHRDLQAEIDKVQRTIEQAGSQALQSVTEGLEEKLRAAMENASAGFLEGARRRVQEECAAATESFSREAATRLAARMEEHLAQAEPQFQAHRAQATEQTKEQIGQLIQAAGAEFGEKLRKTADEMVPSLRQQVEKSLEACAAQFADQLAQRLREQAESAAGTTQHSLLENLQRVQEKVQEEVSGAGGKARQLCAQEAEVASKAVSQRADAAIDSLNLATGQAVAKLLAAQQEMQSSSLAQTDDARRQLTALSAAALRGLEQSTQAQIEVSHKELQQALNDLRERSLREVSDQFQKTTDQVLESSARLLQDQAEDTLDMIAEKLKTSGKESVEEVEKQLAAHSQSLRESLTQEASTVAEDCRGQLRRTLQEFHEQGTRAFEAHLQAAAEKQREIILQQLQQEANQAYERLAAEMKGKSDRLAQDASDAVYKQVGQGAVVLKEWTDHARVRLEAHFRDSIETFQKQISEVMSAALERNRKQCDLLLDDLHSRLQQAARALESTTA